MTDNLLNQNINCKQRKKKSYYDPINNVIRVSKENKFKFWIHSILTMLSISILIINYNHWHFTPNNLGNSTIFYTNGVLSLFSLLYLGSVFYCMFIKKYKLSKNFILPVIIIIVVILSIIISICFIDIFYDLKDFLFPGISLSIQEFSAFYASITGLLAFLAVVLTSQIAERNTERRSQNILEQTKTEAKENRLRAEKAEERLNNQEEESRNRYREDSERTIFFQLLNLYKENRDNMFYKSDTIYQSETEGIDTFKTLTNKLFFYTNFHFIYEQIASNDFEKFISFLKENKESNMDVLSDYNKLLNYYSVCTSADLRKKIFKETSIKQHYVNRKKNTIRYLYDRLHSLYRQHYWGGYLLLMAEKENNYKSISDAIMFATETVYEESEYCLGQYFRTMYYMLDTISKFSTNREYYYKLFRSQISRFELPVVFYNCFNINATNRTIDLFTKHDMLNNLNIVDLFYNEIPNTRPEKIELIKVLLQYAKEQKESNKKTEYINP